MVKMRDEVQWFAEQMELQLRANDHKGGWKESPDNYLSSEALKNLYKAHDLNISPEERHRRFVNTANFMMMLADNARRGTDG